jgi:diguanylate cyclase (GGDEF)-like protein
MNNVDKRPRGLNAELTGSEVDVSEGPKLDTTPLQIDHLPARVPPKALALSSMALITAIVGSLLWPNSADEYSGLVWLLAIVPAFLFAYYKGWPGAMAVLISAMILLAVLEVGFSLLVTGDVAWWIVGAVTVVLIGVSLGAGLISEAHRGQTAEALKLAYADPLTGLPNRRVLQMFLSREFAATTRGRPCSIVLLDIDRFKTINDTDGHQAGDDVLRAVAQALEENTRASDLSGRFGGDEFLTLLPGTNVRGALAFAERTKDAIASRYADTTLPVTISIGVAVSNSSTKTEDDLLQAADIALYSAKRKGGDQAVVAGPWPMEEVELQGAAEREGSLVS